MTAGSFKLRFVIPVKYDTACMNRIADGVNEAFEYRRVVTGGWQWYAFSARAMSERSISTQQKSPVLGLAFSVVLESETEAET